MTDRIHLPWISDAQARVYWPKPLLPGVGKVDRNDRCYIELPPNQDAFKRRKRQAEPMVPPPPPAGRQLILSTKIPFVTPGEARFIHPITVRAGEDSICGLSRAGTQDTLRGWGESECTFVITRTGKSWDVTVRFASQWTRAQGVEYEIQVQAPMQIRQAAPVPALVPLVWGAGAGPEKRIHLRRRCTINGTCGLSSLHKLMG